MIPIIVPVVSGGGFTGILWLDVSICVSAIILCIITLFVYFEIDLLKPIKRYRELRKLEKFLEKEEQMHNSTIEIAKKICEKDGKCSAQLEKYKSKGKY